MSSSVSLTPSGPPETRLPDEPADVVHIARQLESDSLDPAERRALVTRLIATAPRSSAAWAAYGDNAADVIERYAAYRVGYHRGLDTLRANGWKGSGYVRWSHAGNVGFLRCLDGLRRAATDIGEADEADRCRLFLMQLDPAWSAAE